MLVPIIFVLLAGGLPTARGGACPLVVGDITRCREDAPGLVALYSFRRPAAGSLVEDKVGSMHMSLQGDGAQWLAGPQGLRFSAAGGAAFLRSPEAWTRAVQASSSFSVEAWVSPLSDSQSPALLFAVAEGSECATSSDAMLLQEGTEVETRIRTSPGASFPFGGTCPNRAHFPSFGAFFAPRKTHLVWTWDGSVQRVFRDGALYYITPPLGGPFALQWQHDMTLQVGHLLACRAGPPCTLLRDADNLDTQWLGTFHLLALYSQALQADVVGRLFAQGHDVYTRDEVPGAPTVSAATTRAPTQIPTTAMPTTQSPTTESPTTQAPTTQAPTTLAPTAPGATGTTQAPTTLAPTTAQPTTESPTTQAPTSQAPTTQAPTTRVAPTVADTTQAPTSLAPTSIAPTTLAPSAPGATGTTQAPTTLAPTTLSPTAGASSPAPTVALNPTTRPPGAPTVSAAPTPVPGGTGATAVPGVRDPEIMDTGTGFEVEMAVDSLRFRSQEWVDNFATLLAVDVDRVVLLGVSGFAVSRKRAPSTRVSAELLDHRTLGRAQPVLEEAVSRFNSGALAQDISDAQLDPFTAFRVTGVDGPAAPGLALKWILVLVIVLVGLALILIALCVICILARRNKARKRRRELELWQSSASSYSARETSPRMGAYGAGDHSVDYDDSESSHYRHSSTGARQDTESSYEYLFKS